MSGDTSLGDEAEQHAIYFSSAEAAEKARRVLEFQKREGAAWIFDGCGHPLFLRVGTDGSLRFEDWVEFRNYREFRIIDDPDLAARRIAPAHDCPCVHCAHLRASTPQEVDSA